MMTPNELKCIKELIEALQRKCKTDALYLNCVDGLKIVNRELAADARQDINDYDEREHDTQRELL